MDSWASHQFHVEMPHMVPGEKLSEVEFLKILAAYQWQSIADMLETPPQHISNDQNERLYGSVIDFEINFAASVPDVLCEGEPVYVRNRVAFFAKRFVEGFFVFDRQPIPEAALSALKRKSDLASFGLPCAYMTNAFIARTGGNTRLKVYVPSGIDDRDVAELRETPGGIEDHRRVQASGEIDALEASGAAGRLLAECLEPIRYEIVPESDLNGAGLVYFARYLAMMNYGERILLSERLGPPLSHPLVACLSPEHRRVFFFANASPSDAVEIRVSAQIVAEGPDDPRPRRWRTPFRIEFRHELLRSSDKVLMAVSRVRKALNVPADQKGVLMEAERLLARL